MLHETYRETILRSNPWSVENSHLDYPRLDIICSKSSSSHYPNGGLRMTRYSNKRHNNDSKLELYKNENKQTNHWTLLLGNKINNSTSCFFFGSAETWFFYIFFLFFFFEFFFFWFFSFFFLFIHLAAGIQTESQWPPQTYSTEYGWSYNSKKKK